MFSVALVVFVTHFTITIIYSGEAVFWSLELVLVRFLMSHDFLNPNAHAWWAGLYRHEAYPASMPALYAWNDMNEPAVSDGPEGTLPKDAKHHSGLEHRQVHNMYRYLNSMATYKGLVTRGK